MQKLFQECAKNGVRVRVNEFPKKVSPKIISITFPDIDAHTLVLTLSNYDVCVSTSSACSSSEMKPSHVLTSCGFTADEALSTIRVSFSLFNTISEVIGAASIIAECVKLLTTEVF